VSVQHHAVKVEASAGGGCSHNNWYYSKSQPHFRVSTRAAQITRNAMEMTSGAGAARVPRPLRRRLVRTSLGAGPSRPDADASDERIVELWLRDRPANTRVAYERDYARFRTFIGSRSLRTVGLGDLSDFAATLTGSAATRRRTLSAIKAIFTAGSPHRTGIDGTVYDLERKGSIAGPYVRLS
jgi:hypothetical protein